MNLKSLSDDELRKRLLALTAQERGATAEVLRHLAEVDARHASDGWGYTSLFFYCREELKLSEAAAYKRITVARLGRSFPVVFDLVEAGQTNLQGLLVIGAHLTPENHQRVLERIQGKSKREAEVIAAELAPRPDVLDSIRKIPSRAAPAHPAPAESATSGPLPTAGTPSRVICDFYASPTILTKPGSALATRW